MDPQGTERRLAAIMFTDIVGYTALMAESEAKGLRARERHRALVRPLVEKYHGESIEARGDESLSVFPTALDAVSCALAIGDQLQREADLKLHVGIHLGDVVVREGEVSGDGVNIASRICALSQDGGLCVSGEVYQSVRNQPDIEAVALGERELKNVGRPVAVYALGRPGALPVRAPRVASSVVVPRYAIVATLVVALAAAGWWAWNRTTATMAPIRSIAVLPLENLSGDAEQEYIADGMTEALIGELAKLRSLSVISRTSVMRYKRSDKSLPEIAAELGVEGVLEGTVIREGDQVRVTAQLIDARSDMHVWAGRFDREMSGVLALQSDVARAIAEQVRLELSPEEQVALTARRPVDPRAYDAYLRGLQLQGPPTRVFSWGPGAIEHFEQAVELDADFAEGHVALARARGALGAVGLSMQFRGQFPQAREHAKRALELDERLGGAHAALAAVRLWYDWDFPGYKRAIERAWQLSSSDPYVLDAYIAYLFREGRTEEALDVMERLLRVAPFDLYFRAQRVTHFYGDRQYDRALEEFERVRELDPDYFDTVVSLTYIELGRFEEAHRASMANLETCGAPCDLQREALARGWAESGWEGSQRALLEVATELEGFPPVGIAMTYGFLGETDEALVWLERGYRERDPLMITLDLPTWDPLRSDPRFQDLLRRIGFPES